jgi:eukaryotic-like serine/threonine-protein kinase
MSAPPKPTSQFDSADWNEVDAIIQDFQSAWQAGRQPAVEDFLPPAAACGQAVLIELIHVDLEHRIKAGQAVRVETYLQQHPQLRGNAGNVVALIVAECHWRRQGEPGLSPREYQERFPEYWDQAAEQIEALSISRTPPRTPRNSPGSTVPPRDGVELTVPDEDAGFRDPSWPVVPGYEVVGELGRGGMGIVYKVRQLSLGRIVALKMILSGEQASRDELARLRAEARTLGELQHPNIVAIHDVGEHQGRPFLALEYLEGGALAQKLAAVPQPARESAQLLVYLARAVQAAHEKGVIHRDLKPGNVLLTADGTPKVSDFGLAKRLEDSTSASVGGVRGTPPYMPPEQASGLGQDIGPTADVYALGATLYEMLTGRPPFRGASHMDTLRQVLELDPVPPRRLNPAVPRDLETVCLKCLQKTPARRYSSARELAEDLQRFLAGEPVLARPVGRIEQLGRWALQHKPLVAAAAAFLITGAVALGFLIHSWDAARRLAGQNGELFLSEKAARKESEKKQVLLTARLYGARIDQAWAAWQSARLSQARIHLDSIAPGPGEEDLRDFEWHYLDRLAHNALLSRTGFLNVLSFRPEDHKLHVVRNFTEGGKRLQDTKFFQELQTLDTETDLATTSVRIPALRDGRLMPDGQMYVGFEGQLGRPNTNVVVVDFQTGKEVRRFSLGQSTMLQISPDGKWVFHTSIQPSGKPGQPPLVRLAVYDVQKGNVAWDVKTNTYLGGIDSTISPDGRWVVLQVPFQEQGKNGRRVRWLSTATGEEVGPLDLEPTPGAYRFQFVQDGQGLAGTLNTVPQRLAVWDLSQRKRTSEFALPAGASILAFSPDGRRVVLSGPQEMEVWDTTRGVKLFSIGLATRVVFSPDGRQLAYLVAHPLTGFDANMVPLANVTMPIHIVDADSGRLLQIIPGHFESVLAMVFSPDGKRLASWGKDRLVKIWNLKKLLDPVWNFRAGEKESYQAELRFSADGRRLLAQNPDFLGVFDATADPEVDWRRLPVVPSIPGYSIPAAGYNGAGPGFTWVDAYGAVQAYQPGDEARPSQVTAPGGNRILKAAALSADGKRLAVGDGQGVVTLRSLPDGKELAKLAAHEGEVLQLAFSPEGGKLASAGVDRTVRLWALPDGRPLHVFRELRAPARRLLFGPDNVVLAAGLRDGGVNLLNAATGQAVRAVEAGDGPLAFSPDGKRLAVCGRRRGEVTVSDALTGAAPTSLPGSGDTVQALVFTPNGQQLACGGEDGVVRIYNQADGKELHSLAGHRGTIWALACSPDGQALASGGQDQQVRIWNLADGKERCPPLSFGSMVDRLAFRADGKQLAACCTEKKVSLRDAGSGQWVNDLVTGGHYNTLEQVEVAEDMSVAASINQDGRPRLWDLAGASELLRLQPPAPLQLQGKIALADGGGWLALASPVGKIHIWETKTGSWLRALDVPGLNPQAAFAISPDGARLAAVDIKHNILVYDRETGRLLHRLEGHTGTVLALVFRRGGGELASAGADKSVRLWDLASGEVRATLQGHEGEITSLVYTGDGRRLATGSADQIRFWNADSGEVVQVLRGHGGPVRTLAISPNGRRVASVSDDQTVRLWDVVTGEQILRLPASFRGAARLRFAPDGRRLTLVAGDTSVRTWSAGR